jgi:hypothetical protein
MFNGYDYHHAFEEARDELAGSIHDRDQVLGKLVRVEWTLWEAMRGAMIQTGSIAGLLVSAPIIHFAWLTGNSSWTAAALFLPLWLTVTTGLYWVFKFVVHFEIARHVKGRRFGHLDLPWLPGSRNYDPAKYPRDP